MSCDLPDLLFRHSEKSALLQKLKQGTLSECVFEFAPQEERHAGVGQISLLGEGGWARFLSAVIQYLHTMPQAPPL